MNIHYPIQCFCILFSPPWYTKFLMFKFYFLSCQSLSPFSVTPFIFFLVSLSLSPIFNVLNVLLLLANAFQLRSPAIRIMPLLFVSPKSWNIPTTIPIFCTYIKHGNHFPYKRAYFLVDRAYFSFSISRTHRLELSLTFTIQLAGTSFWFTAKFNPYPRRLLFAFRT